MTASPVNPWELLGRERKASRVALWLSREFFGRDALRAAEMATEAQWEAIAISAGVHPPSEETRAEVREILRGIEAERALEATKQAIGLGR